LNLITQFFRNSKEEVDNTLNFIDSFISNNNISKVYIFSDMRIRTENNKVTVLRKNSRLKWSNVFEFIYSNGCLNSEGTYVIEPNSKCSFKLNKDGIYIFNNGIYIRNIKKTYPNIRRYIFKDYEFLRLNINDDNFKIASICHIYYEDLLEDIIDSHNNLLTTNFNIDFYFTLNYDSSTIGQKIWVKNKLKENFPNCEIFELPNKGLDIGPFFKVLEHIILTNKNYDYVVKTHTKKSLRTSGKFFGNIWRKDLFSILNNIERVNQYMLSGEYMIGSNKWIIPIEKDNLNKNKIEEIKKELGIIKGDQFVGGTMFWIKYSIIKKYFNLDNIRRYYNDMEDGYHFQIHKGDKEYLTHSFERIFGLIVGNENKKIIGI